MIDYNTVEQLRHKIKTDKTIKRDFPNTWIRSFRSSTNLDLILFAIKENFTINTIPDNISENIGIYDFLGRYEKNIN